MSEMTPEPAEAEVEGEAVPQADVAAEVYHVSDSDAGSADEAHGAG